VAARRRGGNGIPGSHLDVDEARDREDDGVLIAPADAALREAGGLDSAGILDTHWDVMTQEQEGEVLGRE